MRAVSVKSTAEKLSAYEFLKKLGESVSKMSDSKYFLTLGILLFFLLGMALLSLVIGPVSLSPSTVFRSLFVDNGAVSIVVNDIRLPRTLLAILIGAMLGLSGAALQGLLRNPLADPSIFGAPQMAGLGAVLALYFGFASALSWGLPFAAIMGALISIIMITLVTGRNSRVVILVLTGLTVGNLATAMTSLAISMSPNPYAVTEIVFWLLGSLEDRSMTHVGLAAPFILVSVVVLMKCAPSLRALTLGEEAAYSLGIHVTRLRFAIVAASAIGVGASVAVAGSIGFIGLVAPHFARPLTGYDPARSMPVAMLSGALILLMADCLTRVIPTVSEIKIGVVTSLLGAPFFLWIIARRKAELTEADA